MTGTKIDVKVNGKMFRVWADFIKRCMFAENEDGIIKMIHNGGYIKNELTTRKAISAAYGMDSFKK